MVKKRQSNINQHSLGITIAVVLILFASYLSSTVYEAPQYPTPTIESTGQVVTGQATTITTTCTDDKTIVRTNTNGNAAAYNTADTTTYSRKVCADTSLGTGHACIYPTTTAAPTGQPAYCSDNTWSGDESDQDCGGSCTKCLTGLSCWGNSDCSSNICWFDNTVMAKRTSAGISKDQRLPISSSNIQYQGVCVASAPSTGGIVGGAIVDVTGSPLISPTQDTQITVSSEGSSTTTTTTAPSAQPINTIIRLGSDNTVEKVGYSGAATTGTQPTTIDNNGAITTCNSYLSSNYGTQDPFNSAKCTPSAPATSGLTLLGTMYEVNLAQIFKGGGADIGYNAYAIYVSSHIKGEIISCAGGPGNIGPCVLPACNVGTLQDTFTELHSIEHYIKFGICADAKIKLASCTQSSKGRSCTTTAPQTGFKKLDGYVTDVVDVTGGRYFVYYDAYIEPTKATTTPTAASYIDVCFGSGPYHYETPATKGTCSPGSNCIFTISAETGAKVADCSANGYAISVCSGGYCTGRCDQSGCQYESSCNANPSCAWDAFEKNPTQPKCKSKSAVCNIGGIGLCTPAAFRAGDYSCLSKDPQTGFYTRACVGAGQFGFWQIPETY